jgi:hypothetical protein
MVGWLLPQMQQSAKNRSSKWNLLDLRYKTLCSNTTLRYF